MAEFELIDFLRAELEAKHAPNKSLQIPPGDDCALVPAGGGSCLYAADMLMDGVHFDLRHTSAELAGRKALAVNISDIAAMAGTPTSVTVCLALPKQKGTEVGKGVMRGVIDLAREFDVAVAGGDTNSWNGPLVISVAILGEAHPRGSVTRTGARAGDIICVTGTLGGSIAGKHLKFMPRVEQARIMHERYGLNSMIDLSDGLGSDLRHVLKGSGVGAVLERSAIPVTPAVAGPQGLEHAMSDGEDFELCFTLPDAAAQQLIKDQPFGKSLLISAVGKIVPGSDLKWDNGSAVTFTGYRHAFD